jgi:hypothetical protein
MIELAAYVVVVAAVAGVGIVLGMILGRRIDRRLTPPDADPPAPSSEEQP